VTRVIWTKTALERVEQIADYIAVDNPDAAVQMIDTLFDRVLMAADHPLLAPIHEPSRDPTIRQLLAKPYLVLYRVDESDALLTVLTIRHARQEPRPADEG
jgi:addiction module RelE/StbE family toxin